MECAIKCIKKEDIVKNKCRIDSMMSELEVLERVSHPTLVRTYQLLHDEKYYYIVTELAT